MSKKKEKYIKPVLRKIYRMGLGVHAVFSGVQSRGNNEPHVYYGGARSGDGGGTLVKVARLQKVFPEYKYNYNLVYVLSNTAYLPKFAFYTYKKRSIPIVHNQNGVFYPGWYGGDYIKMNQQMSLSYHYADYVFYQSEFCRMCANKYLGERLGRGEILYNAVDIKHFKPLKDISENGSRKPFVFLITGKIDKHLFYRIESTMLAIAKLRQHGMECKLNIAGMLDNYVQRAISEVASELNISKYINIIGPYTQKEAPLIYKQADAYVMTKHNDPCPNTVIEALSCGLPVVYSNSGGVPELVGSSAGIAVDVGDDWEKPSTPSPELLADAMLSVAENIDDYSQSARNRAVSKFNVDKWMMRHKTIFVELLGR